MDEAQNGDTLVFGSQKPSVLDCWWFKLGALLGVVAIGAFAWIFLVIQFHTEQQWADFQRILDIARFSYAVPCDQCRKTPQPPVMQALLAWAIVPPAIAVTVWATIKFLPHSRQGPNSR